MTDRVEQLIALCPEGEDFIIRNKCSDDLTDQCRRIRLAFHSAAHDIHEYVFQLIREDGVIKAELLDGEPNEEEMAMLIDRIAHHTGHRVILANIALPALIDEPSRLMLSKDIAESFHEPT